MSANAVTPSKPVSMTDLAEVAFHWQKHRYVSFADRERVLDLAAIGVIVHQLIESSIPLAPELKRIIEVARNNRSAVTCNLS